MSLGAIKLAPMRYGIPIQATLEGGDFDGKTITLPEAYRGVDIEKDGKAARYRFEARRPDGSFRYAYQSPRRTFHKGAPLVAVTEGMKVAGLRFYPGKITE